VFRPCDAVEVAECWELALNRSEAADRAGADAAEPAAMRTTAGAEKSVAAKAAMELVAAQGEAKKVSFSLRFRGRDRG